MNEYITIRGARQHNLKNISLEIPRNKLIVITGPSGSGKSSLAIDTIFAEGQRRYVESLSIYARQFLGQIQKPEVDYIDGLSPSIAIEQKTISKSPRSTVGTLTEIYDYLRVLYTRIGKPYCIKCSKDIVSQDAESIIKQIEHLKQGTKIQILCPIVKERKGSHSKELNSMRREGFVRARIDGEMEDITEDIPLNKHKRHTIDVVIDRLIIKPQFERKLKDSINIALKFSNIVLINLIAENKDLVLSKTMACPQCGLSIEDINPMLFSFNSSVGACPNCNGLGFINIDEKEEHDIDRDYKICQQCGGARLKNEALSVRIAQKNIAELSHLDVRDLSAFFNSLKLDERETFVAKRIIKEISDRLTFLENVGLIYLTLDRTAATLSGGEAQRMRLATQIGSSLSGVLYVLDEPSIGLHPKDCSKLIDTLIKIKEAGNTIIVVEHDEETILNSDIIIDMGPGAGHHGGSITAIGSAKDIISNDASLTGKYLCGKLNIAVPANRRQPKDFITITGAQQNNLKNLTVKIPLGIMTCVTGVSGSGKSTLILDTLYKSLMNKIYESKLKAGKCDTIEGDSSILRLISVDQSPIGKTPRSNPATYTGIFTIIRELFATLLDAKARGYKLSRFSFNVKGGRCEECKGAGIKKYEMMFLPNAYVRCDVCGGRRFNRETLDILYKRKTIAEILDMSISEAREFFINIPALNDRLSVLEDVGLGYLHLGQSAATLSGGEAQRLKLSKELAKKSTGKNLYILDEPTTGLHFADIDRLLKILHSLTDLGNTIIVIEHNLDIIKSADYIIDMGPEGGQDGGYIIAQGSPEHIASCANSFTGKYLKKKLQ
ncbi:excinuclease ABC subunit A [Candidatus Magnetoovum chiemensis]|nr:excinuclease ABC subunit A [Candidatus Magnetoovum chiemensis]